MLPDTPTIRCSRRPARETRPHGEPARRLIEACATPVAMFATIGADIAISGALGVAPSSMASQIDGEDAQSLHHTVEDALTALFCRQDTRRMLSGPQLPVALASWSVQRLLGQSSNFPKLSQRAEWRVRPPLWEEQSRDLVLPPPRAIRDNRFRARTSQEGRSR